jgi:hypothetical protein
MGGAVPQDHGPFLRSHWDLEFHIHLADGNLRVVRRAADRSGKPRSFWYASNEEVALIADLQIFREEACLGA